MTTTVTIPHTSGPLVLGSVPLEAGLYLSTRVAEPAWEYRYREAAAASDRPGRVLLGAVLDQASVPLTVYARAASQSALEGYKLLLDQALAAYPLTITVVENGVTRTYSCWPSRPTWEADDGMASAFMARATVTIPINP